MQKYVTKKDKNQSKKSENAPKCIIMLVFQLIRTGKEPWGLEIAGDSPVKIKAVVN